MHISTPDGFMKSGQLLSLGAWFGAHLMLATSKASTAWPHWQWCELKPEATLCQGLPVVG
jgi:hypothetical protein